MPYVPATKKPAQGTPRPNQTLRISLPQLSFAVLMALTLSSPTDASGGFGLGESCTENGDFFCSDSSPGSFTRCIDEQLYVFHCPEGLHFNTLTQTCDWPENADCGDGKRKEGNGEEESEEWSSGIEEGEKEEEEEGEAGHWKEEEKEEEEEEEESWSNSERTKDSNSASGSRSHGHSHSASGNIRLSGSAKPWWRPDNVDPKAWEDTNNLVEVPFDGSVSESASAKKEESGSGNTKSKSSARKSGGGHSHKLATSTAEKRPSLGEVQWQEGPCDPSACQPPNCRCPGTVIPGGLSARSTPQMVMLTFDDEVSAAYYGYFQRLFRPGRYNPNGCPVRGCLFVSGSGTDYDLVYPLYAMGVEVASHTLSHKFPHTWWATASYREYVDEIEGMRRALASKSGIPHDTIKGFRVPFLQVGGDNMYKALYDQKFLYDTSMFTGSVWEGSDPVWPFTLDYTIPEVFCQHGPCPKKQYPGLWEIPVQRWYGVDGHSCGMPDGCTASADVDEDLEFFRSNFKRFYESNRAPFGIFVHARWFHTEHHLEALDQFIDELMQLNDVFIVTPSQVIEWMKDPTSLDNIRSFAPWDCEGSVSSESQWR